MSHEDSQSTLTGYQKPADHAGIDVFEPALTGDVAARDSVGKMYA